MARLRPETRAQYVSLATYIITEVARGKRSKKIITYEDLMDEMGGPGRGYIAEVLDKVSTNTYNKEKILLSALVVHTPSGGGMPGDSFWQIGILDNSVKLTSKSNKIAFWKEQCQLVWEWAKK